MKTFLLVLILSLSVGASAVSAADSPVSFAGTWKTIAGGSHQYTLILKQTGNKVTGTYSPGNGKLFDGVVTGRKLIFKWTQDGGFEGTGEFTMDQEGKGFTGSSTALKPDKFTVTWNTFEPAVVSFAGTWETISNGKNPFTLTIIQTGRDVTGVYPGGNGKIEGVVSGRVLRFKWQSSGGTGSGRFVMDEGAQSFSGSYNRGDNPDDVDATWSGKRPAPVPISFTGVWKATRGTTPLTFKLLQTGDQVTGQFQSDTEGSAVVFIDEGTVVKNTLRFKFKLASSDRTARGSAELVLAEDGKSFKGKIAGVATTATFVSTEKN